MPVKGDASKISVKLGSITPHVVNGMQVPATTSSTPPNLDEQRRDQVWHDSMKSNPSVPLPVAPKQQLRKNRGVVDKSIEKEDRAASKAMMDQVVPSDIPAVRAMSAEEGLAQLLSNAFTDTGGRTDDLNLSNLKGGKMILGKDGRNPPESKNNVGSMGPLQTADLKENSALDTVKAKSFASKRKKKGKEILQNADAAGASSDLYLAYKGPEDSKGIAAYLDKEIASPDNNPKHLSAEGCGEASVVSKGSDRSKTEPWGDVAEISTTKLTDDDRWNKLPGPFAAGQNMHLDVGFGMDMGFRPGHGGNIGVLRNPRVQASVPYISGLLSGPMQSLGSQGGLVRNSPDTDRWKRAARFQQKGLLPSPHTPLQAMHKAEKKYEVCKVTDEEEAKQRQLKAILNKLTPQNFEKLFEQVKAVNIDNAVTLTSLISQIFDKALMEPTFCEIYADLCCHLAKKLPDFSDGNEKITFKRLLLNKCQEEFERGEREQEEADNVHEEGEVKLSEERREEKRIKARRRMLGNIRLLGELYKKRMLTEKIMHECIKKLLGQHQTLHEEDIETLCILMSTIGEMIDHPKARDFIDVYFERMEKLSNNAMFSSRVRFMLKDAIELRKRKWQQRRKVTHGLGSMENAGHGSRADTTTLTERFPGHPSYNQYSMPDPNNSSAVATSPSSPGQDRDFSGDIPSEKKWPEEKLRNMSIAAIREFYSAKDENDVALCIKDMKSASFYPSMVSLWVMDSFERMAVERDLLANLLVNLTRPQDGMLSQVQLIKGFESVLHCLEDAVIDAPKAPKFLGRIFGKVVSENRVSLKEIGQIILEGGEEPGGLLEAGLAAIVLESTLEMIESLKGESVLDEVWTSSNLRLEDFRPFDPIKSSLLGRSR